MNNNNTYHYYIKYQQQKDVHQLLDIFVTLDVMKMKMIIGIKPKMVVKHKISSELKIMNQRTTATNPIPGKELKMIAKMILHHHPSKILNKPRANPTPNNNRMTPQDKMM